MKAKYIIYLGLCSLLSGCSVVTNSDTNTIDSTVDSITDSDTATIEGKTIIFDNESDDSFLGNDYNEEIIKNNGYEFYRCKQLENGYISMKSGGYIKNYTPIYNIDYLKINYEISAPYGKLAYKVSDQYIDAPHVANYTFNSGKELNLSYSNDEQYFSLYCATGSYDINSIQYTTGNSFSESEYSDIQKIDIYSMNDFHGAANGDGDNAGIGKIAKYLDTKVKENPKASLILSQGDMWQGTADSNLTRGLLIDEWMNNVGFESMALGNHEFDWTQNQIRLNQEHSNFPYLACDIYYRDGSGLVDYVTPSIMVERLGIKIGIIGSVGNCLSSISGSLTKDIYFLYGDALTNAIKAESNKLKEKGADIIILSMHSGENGANYNYDVSLSIDGYIDLVLEGHSHQYYSYQDDGDVWHIQSSSVGTAIGHTTITYNRTNKTKKITASNIYKSEYFNSSSDTSTITLYDYLESTMIADIRDEYVATINRTYNSNQIANAVLETAFNKYTPIAIEQGYNITLAGSYLKTRNPYSLYPGDVTYGDIYSLLPFDNDYAVCSIKGDDLIDRFINNSTYIIYPYVDEYTIDPAKTYYVISDSYTFDYAPNNMTVVYAFNDGIYHRDLFKEYLRSL